MCNVYYITLLFLNTYRTRACLVHWLCHKESAALRSFRLVLIYWQSQVGQLHLQLQAQVYLHVQVLVRYFHVTMYYTQCLFITAKTSPHIQTVVVKTFFVPWDKGQIHVQPQQKVKVDTRNLARTKSGKNVPFVKVLTESGRKGKVPVSVLDIESLPAACTSSQLTDNQSLQQSHRDRTSISSSNG